MKKRSNALLLLVLAGVAFNAHALCVNPDGSLDDPSMSPSTIAVEELPACGDSASKTVNAPAPGASQGKPHKAEPVQPAVKTKTDDKHASNKGDCRTKNGESREGYLGATELLPECNP